MGNLVTLIALAGCIPEPAGTYDPEEVEALRSDLEALRERVVSLEAGLAAAAEAQAECVTRETLASELGGYATVASLADPSSFHVDGPYSAIAGDDELPSDVLTGASLTQLVTVADLATASSFEVGGKLQDAVVAVGDLADYATEASVAAQVAGLVTVEDLATASSFEPGGRLEDSVVAVGDFVPMSTYLDFQDVRDALSTVSVGGEHYLVSNRTLRAPAMRSDGVFFTGYRSANAGGRQALFTADRGGTYIVSVPINDPADPRGGMWVVRLGNGLTCDLVALFEDDMRPGDPGFPADQADYRLDCDPTTREVELVMGQSNPSWTAYWIKVGHI
ncbi:MAG: hypothetical protein H6734_26270 [Alphaproteobacteria bacterium]|nr:hypothetical protein [Alphaproteobacteria bacterium]